MMDKIKIIISVILISLFCQEGYSNDFTNCWKRRKKHKKEVKVEKIKPIVDSVQFLDISSLKISSKKLNNIIRKKSKSGCDTLYITIFSEKGSAIKVSTFKNVLLDNNLYLANTSFTPEAFSQVVNAKNIVIIPTLQISAKDLNFEKIVGHEVFSDEGMCFIDDYIKNVFFNKNIKMCQLKTDASEVQYNRFLKPIIANLLRAGVYVKE